jgi:hypothetical protein
LTRAGRSIGLAPEISSKPYRHYAVDPLNAERSPDGTSAICRDPAVADLRTVRLEGAGVLVR